MYANGLYYQYYAIPYEPGTSGAAEAVIGLATSPNAWGPWTDKGWIVSSWSPTSTPPTGFGFTPGSTFNAIDPAPFTDAAGNWWLSFGSWFDGIHLVQLDPTTGLPVSKDPSTYPVIAYRAAGEEGSFIYPWTVNGTQYYYYFAPINVCCQGDSSTYRIIYGRSTTPGGPYLDRGGLDLKNGGGTILLSAHGNINGPGGQSVFTDTGSDGSNPCPPSSTTTTTATTTAPPRSASIAWPSPPTAGPTSHKTNRGTHQQRGCPGLKRNRNQDAL
jgi:arabinan endo-1,5-alpha-L-arabinosidase